MNDDYKTINGRWWYLEGTTYKEIHANDSCIYLFDFSNYTDRCYQLEYVIRNDTFWTLPPKKRFSSLNMEPYYRGKVIAFDSDSFLLMNNKTKVTYHKLDEIEDIYTKNLPNVFKNEKLDTTAWERWLNYQDKYDQRAKEFYKKHLEYKQKGAKN
ncbi:MAG: hypothetical protein ABFS16_16255 [Bacteroidota bacterium]